MNRSILLLSKCAEELQYEPHSEIDSNYPIILRSVHEHRGASNIHENIEVFAFFGGCGQVRCNSEIYDLAAGDVLVVNSYVEHHKIFTESPKAVCMIIDAGFCKINGIDIHGLRFTPFIRDEKLIELVRKLCDEFTSDNKFKDTAIKCALLNMLLYLCVNWSHQREDNALLGSKSLEIVCKAVDYIKRNFNKKLRVDDIAESVKLSKYYFLREFKRVTGCTVVEYINIIRCEYAAELLKTGKYTIKEVAIKCGFDDFSYFTKVFKEKTDQLPSNFKNSERVITK